MDCVANHLSASYAVTTKTDSSLVGSHILVGLYTLACADCGHVEFFAKLPPVL
jgi:hypothetical protein